MRLGALLTALVSTGCSLGNTVTDACTNDAQCEAAFGPGSTCGGQGFCVVSGSETCEVDDPVPEVAYDGIDNDCDPLTPDDDLDGDGFALVDDCDDADPDRHLAGTLATGVVSSDQVPALCDQRCVAMTVLQGNLVLDSALDNLGGLSCLQEIAGSLDLTGTGVSSLGGLSNVTRIRGDVAIDDEPNLQRLTGLGKVETIDGSLRLSGNARLIEVTTGLEELVKVDGALEITDNPRLADESATAMRDGILVEGDVVIADNGLGLDFDNAGFEEHGLRTPDDWFGFPDGTLEGTVALIGDPFPSPSKATFAPLGGKAALRLAPPEVVDKKQPLATIYQEHPTGFAVGETFELTGWGFVAADEALEKGCMGYLVIKYFRPNFAFIGEDISEVLDLSTPPDEWTALTVQGTVPADTVVVQAGAELLFDDECGGAVYFDDLKMRKIGGP